MVWKTCIGSNCFSAKRKSFLAVEALDATSEDSAVLTDATVNIYSGYPADYDDCASTSSCGTLVDTGTIGGPVQRVPPAETPYLVVVSLDDYYTSYFEVEVDMIGAIKRVDMVPRLDSQQDRVVLSWASNQDYDLWIKANFAGEPFYVSWEDTVATENDQTVALDVDNQDGFDGPETARFESLTSGTFEVWINNYDSEFTQETVMNAPATVEVYCYSCADGSGESRAGKIASVVQMEQDAPVSGAAWWKAGQFVAPSDDSAERLQWKPCTSNCYSPAAPYDQQRRQLTSWFSSDTSQEIKAQDTGQVSRAMRPHAKKRGVKKISDRGATHSRSRMLIRAHERKNTHRHDHKAQSHSATSNRSPWPASWRSVTSFRKIKKMVGGSISSTVDQHPARITGPGVLQKFVKSSVLSEKTESKKKVRTHRANINARTVAGGISTTFKRIQRMSRIPRPVARIHTKVRRLTEPHRSRKLLQIDAESDWVLQAKGLITSAIERESWVELNQISAVLSLELDQRYGSEIESRAQVASTKTFLIERLSSAVTKAVKNEGYICQVLGLARAVGGATDVVSQDATKLITHILKTLLSVETVQKLDAECAANAVGILSESLVATDQKICDTTLGARSESSTINLVHDLEGVMRNVAKKTASSLVTGQRKELVVQKSGSTSARHSVMKKSIDSLISSSGGVDSQLSAATGDIEGLVVSYSFPETVVKDVPDLASTSVVQVHFGTFGHAPAVQGIQPISPLVTLSLSAQDGSEIAVAGLTNPVEVTMPIVHQTACGPPSASYDNVECRYWDKDKEEYSAEGCRTIRGRIFPSIVTCSCNHLTSFVLVDVEVHVVECPANSMINADAEQDISNCVCNGGYYGPNGGPCAACEAGKYRQRGANNPTCFECDAGKYLDTMANDAVSDCINCAAGKYSSGIGMPSSDTCRDCAAGKFSKFDGAKDAQTCSTCSAGTYTTSTGSTSCQNCPAGTYSIGTGRTTESTCVECGAGKYSSTISASSASTCKSCPENKPQSAAGSTSEESCLSDCPIGYTLLGQSCIPCPAGFFKPETGNAACKPCPAGTLSERQWGSVECLCKPGSTGSSGSCTTCAAGTYKTVAGSGACLKCAAGKFSPTEGGSASTVCQPCKAGAYSAVEGAASMGVCTDCNAGTYSSSAATICLACDAGKYSQAGAQTCDDCPAGSTSSAGSSECEGAPPPPASAGPPSTTSPSSPATIVNTTPAPPSVPVLASPAIVPGGGQFTGYVLVTVTPPALAQLALTTDETTPSCDGKLVARSASLTIKEATTLKAVSCKGNTASLIVTKKFEILPGPVVIVSFQIYGSVSAADLSDDMKNDFVGALVEMLRLPSRDLVQDITVKDARRRLLAVDLSLGILTNGGDSADDLQNSIKNTDFGSLTNRAGWSDAAVAGVEVSVLQPDGTAPPTTPPPAKKTAWPVMVAGVVGAVVALTLMATGSFYFYRRGVERKTQTENKLSPASSDVNALDPADLQPSILEEYDCSQDDHVKPEMSTTSLEQR